MAGLSFFQGGGHDVLWACFVRRVRGVLEHVGVMGGCIGRVAVIMMFGACLVFFALRSILTLFEVIGA